MTRPWLWVWCHYFWLCLISYRICKQTQKPEANSAFRLLSQHSNPLYYSMRVQNPYFSHISGFPPSPPGPWNTHMHTQFRHWKSKAESVTSSGKGRSPPDHICFKPTSFITTERSNGSPGDKAVQAVGLCCSTTRTGPRFSHTVITVCGQRGPQTIAEILWLQDKEEE